MNLLSFNTLSTIYENNWFLYPFSGSATIGVAANLSRNRFLGIEKELDFVNISKARKVELNNISQKSNRTSDLSDLSFISKESLFNESYFHNGNELPF